VGLILAAALGGAVFLLLSTPSVAGLAQSDPQTTAVLERALGAGHRVTWLPVPFEAISTDLKLAVVVAEDFRFFAHSGFDHYEIKAAMREAITGKRLRGASTITQQLARNIWLSNDRTLTRKVKEAVLTWKLERRLSKRRILELYLNTAPFGPDTIGVEGAAQQYFGIPASDITRVQAAHLAAGLPAPSLWHPGTKSPRAKRHFQRILEKMDKAAGLRRFL
jgi:monofunctional biosynthetic peptidoglycan transglycosylase